MCRGSPSRIRRTSFSAARRSRAAKSVRILTRWRVGSPWAVSPSGSLSASPIRFFPRSSARMRPFPGFAFVGTLSPIIVIGKVVTESASAERTYRVAISILAAAGGVALLYYGQVFFITVIIAFMIAFLLEPVVRIFMKIRMPRGLASFLVCALWLGCLYFAGLGLYTEGTAMIEDLPAYGARINQLVESAAVRVDGFEKNVYRTLVPRRFQEPDTPQQTQPENPAVRGKKKAADPPLTPPVQEVRVRPEPTAMVSYIYDYLHSFYSVLLMASFIPFLVYFILSWGDHLRARLLFTLEGEPRYTLAKAL